MLLILRVYVATVGNKLGMALAAKPEPQGRENLRLA